MLYGKNGVTAGCVVLTVVADPTAPGELFRPLVRAALVREVRDDGVIIVVDGGMLLPWCDFKRDVPAFLDERGTAVIDDRRLYGFSHGGAWCLPPRM